MMAHRGHRRAEGDIQVSSCWPRFFEADIQDKEKAKNPIIFRDHSTGRLQGSSCEELQRQKSLRGVFPKVCKKMFIANEMMAKNCKTNILSGDGRLRRD